MDILEACGASDLGSNPSSGVSGATPWGKSEGPLELSGRMQITFEFNARCEFTTKC